MTFHAASPLETKNTIGMDCVLLELLLAAAGVGCDDDLVRDVPENREKRPDARAGLVRDGAHGERHLAGPAPAPARTRDVMDRRRGVGRFPTICRRCIRAGSRT